jgi:hypothetical protein
LTGADKVAIMAEVNTSAQQDPRTERPEVIEEGLGQSLAQPASAPPPQAKATQVDAPEVLPPPEPTAQGWASAGWTEEMEDALKGSSIKEEHRALMGTALESYRSAGAALHEVFKNLAAGFEVRILRIQRVYLSYFVFVNSSRGHKSMAF